MIAKQRKLLIYIVLNNYFRLHYYRHLRGVRNLPSGWSSDNPVISYIRNECRIRYTCSNCNLKNSRDCYANKVISGIN